MIISAAILSKQGDVFISDNLPDEVREDIKRQSNDFLSELAKEEEQGEIPYIERELCRYIYRETGDLYWMLVTKPESDMFLDIKILGKFVCTIMEYGIASETNSETLTEEQTNLFYQHVWRPWDDADQCPLCNRPCVSEKVWATEFNARLQFLVSMRDAHVDEEISNYFSGLIYEAWAATLKLHPKWAKHGLICDSSSDFDSEDSMSINEDALLDGCRLKCRLEDLRLELSRLQDPYLRLFARRDLLANSCFWTNGLESSAPTIDCLGSEEQCSQEFCQSSSCDNLNE